MILLATVSVLVIDKHRNKHKVRAILDPGSQSSLITTNICKQLGLQTSKFNMMIEAINGMSSQIEQRCEVTLQAHHNDFRFNMKCLVIPEITGQLPP